MPFYIISFFPDAFFQPNAVQSTAQQWMCVCVDSWKWYEHTKHAAFPAWKIQVEDIPIKNGVDDNFSFTHAEKKDRRLPVSNVINDGLSYRPKQNGHKTTNKKL